MEEKIEKFREYLIEEERSDNTIDSYIATIRIFYKQFPEVNKQNMLKFKQMQLEKWKPKTVHNRIVAMNQFCKFLGHPEYCVKQIKIHAVSSVENAITVQEFNRLLKCLKEDGNEKGYCEMWTKGKIRRIYIPERLIEESREYFESVQGDLLFPNRYGMKMTTRGVSQQIYNFGKKYGIRKEVMHPHSFRHLFAIEFLKKNPNIALLSDLMGHSNVGTTSIYLKLSKEEQMRQFNEASRW